MISDSIISYSRLLIGQLREAGRIRTAETYESSVRSFLRFLDTGDAPLTIISSATVRRYQDWLHEKGKRPGTISFYLRTLRAFYNHAVADDLISDIHPFRKAYTGMPETSKRALSLDELKRIKNFEIRKADVAMEFARDMFLMSFYLRGAALIDLAFMRKCDIRGGRIEYRRRKTGKLLSFEWTPEMHGLAKKYHNPDSPYIFPIITSAYAPLRSFRSCSQKINRSLRRLASLLKIRSGHLTFYSARHTWASLARDAGVPINVISAGMGHSSEATTRIYLTSLDSGIIDRANAGLINLLK